MSSDENELPLVIEPNGPTDVSFLQNFLTTHSEQIKLDIARYGAVLLRGFDVASDADFENTVLSIEGFRGISDAFMSEQGRIHVDNLKYVLHTNAVYKTGGTLYLGGFHSENYYSTDVPAYISFCCLEPSALGGETGLVNAEKVYEHLGDELKAKLERNNFFVSKWLVTDVAQRYQITTEQVEEICHHFDLPIIGAGNDKFVLMYKPNIFFHPITNKKSLQINLFEVLPLNDEMRKCFMNDYPGKTWFWHRVVWHLPTAVMKTLETLYIACASLIHSPKESLTILTSKLKTRMAEMNKKSMPAFNDSRVGSCFTKLEVKQLAKLIHRYYSSCLWKKGDIILVDNLKVLHAGMPGAGSRTIRAMICNPISMKYSFAQCGVINCHLSNMDTVGFYMSAGELPKKVKIPEFSE